jgi:hypothetical protein
LRRAFLLPAAAVALAACLHTRHVGEPAAGGDGERGARTPAARGAGRRVPPAPGRPPLAPSPQALLTPGAARKIQQALASRGLLEGESTTGKLDRKTSAALRRFQEQEGLAATGAPDHETVSRLGLDPQQVFRVTPGADEQRLPELERKGEK